MIRHLVKRNPTALLLILIFGIGSCFGASQMFSYTPPDENPGVVSTQTEMISATKYPVQYLPGVVEVCTFLTDHDGTVNMRELPDVDSPVILVVKEGTQLARTWEGNGWSSVWTLYHENGYIRTKYLCEVK